jgi:hypothetical protein
VETCVCCSSKFCEEEFYYAEKKNDEPRNSITNSDRETADQSDESNQTKDFILRSDLSINSTFFGYSKELLSRNSTVKQRYNSVCKKILNRPRCWSHKCPSSQGSL